MEYLPKVLYNDSFQKKEFLFDSRTYVFEARSKVVVEGPAAYHFLNLVNTGLKDVTGKALRNEVAEQLLDQEEETRQQRSEQALTSADYAKMPWRELVSIASRKGWYQAKMTREDLISIIKENLGEGK